jgi:hypothetical protein
MPFLFPALIKDALSNLTTTINSNGICYQSTDYTCGPAAAVTALRRLGLSANEGELAVLSYTSPIAGTLPTCLTSALQERYGTEGLKCQYRYFDSITQLRNAGITLAVVKDGFMNSHCVTVLGVSDHYCRPGYGQDVDVARTVRKSLAIFRHCAKARLYTKHLIRVFHIPSDRPRINCEAYLSV